MDTPVINICFHGIGEPARELEDGEAPYWITADFFRQTLDEVMTWPSVRLSFDDGNASDIEIGLPELQARDLTATFFVLAGRLDAPGSLDRASVRDLQTKGMTIGTHGMWHRPWRGMDAAETRLELVDAKAQIEDVTGQPVDQAALPLGRYDRRLLTDLRQLGYRRVFCSDRRKTTADRWFQPRFSVTHTDTVESLRRDVLTDPSPTARAQLAAKGLIKRLR